MGEFGIVVVPRDGADPDRIMNHSSILRKYKVSGHTRGWVRLREDPPSSLYLLLPQDTNVSRPELSC